MDEERKPAGDETFGDGTKQEKRHWNIGKLKRTWYKSLYPYLTTTMLEKRERKLINETFSNYVHVCSKFWCFQTLNSICFMRRKQIASRLSRQKNVTNCSTNEALKMKNDEKCWYLKGFSCALTDVYTSSSFSHSGSSSGFSRTRREIESEHFLWAQTKSVI